MWIINVFIIRTSKFVTNHKQPLANIFVLTDFRFLLLFLILLASRIFCPNLFLYVFDCCLRSNQQKTDKLWKNVIRKWMVEIWPLRLNLTFTFELPQPTDPLCSPPLRINIQFWMQSSVHHLITKLFALTAL